MRDALSNFFKLEPQNINSEVLIGLGILYFLLLLGFFFSIFNQPSSWARKMLSVLVVVCLPILGMYLYLAFCFLRADYRFLTRFGMAGPRK